MTQAGFLRNRGMYGRFDADTLTSQTKGMCRHVVRQLDDQRRASRFRLYSHHITAAPCHCHCRCWLSDLARELRVFVYAQRTDAVAEAKMAGGNNGREHAALPLSNADVAYSPLTASLKWRDKTSVE